MKTEISTVRRFAGIGLQVVSAAGLVASIVLIIVIAMTSRSLSANSRQALDLAYSTIETTDQTLVLIDETLAETGESITALEEVTGNVGMTVGGTEDLFTTLSIVFGDDLPIVIEGTQNSLTTAQQSAGIIDGTLRTLSTLPLININYDPETSLSQSIEDINAGLGGLPNSFTAISADLAITASNVGAVSEDLDALGASFTDLRTTTTEARELVADYRILLEDFNTLVETLDQQVTGSIRTLTVAAYFTLLWLAFAQVGLFFQGREMASVDLRGMEARIAELEAKLADQ
ncbi:MAG: hypothetical protein GYB64_15960 [Chloroflexi bacterium]|nr:hypothetical protein [Chloroflexota bacterium]